MRALGNLLVLLLLLFACLAAKAQDTLLTVHGNELVVKLVHISPQTVSFRQPPSDSTIAELPFSQIFLIKYQNGEREVFPGHLNSGPQASAYTPGQLRMLARQDVAQYGNFKTTAAVSGVVSVLYLPIGLLIAVGTGKPGTIYGSQVSDKALLKEKAYVTEYKAEMQRRRRAARFTGVAVGAGVWLTAFMLANAEPL